jgi:quinol monooxygenase YgiN
MKTHVIRDNHQPKLVKLVEHWEDAIMILDNLTKEYNEKNK